MMAMRDCFRRDGLPALPIESQFGKNRSHFETTERGLNRYPPRSIGIKPYLQPRQVCTQIESTDSARDLTIRILRH
jgi:hypothetical protein